MQRMYLYLRRLKLAQSGFPPSKRSRQLPADDGAEGRSSTHRTGPRGVSFLIRKRSVIQVPAAHKLLAWLRPGLVATHIH